MEEVVGFTEKQRQWFLNRSRVGNNGFPRCESYHFDAKKFKWVRCQNESHLEIHHIMPRGFAKLHMPKVFQLNGALNGIVLCRDCCHCGKNGVHPDVYWTRKAYANDKEAFAKMMKRRGELNRAGIPYWDTRKDLLFMFTARNRTRRFVKKNPYPVNGNRGNTGRL